MSKPTVKRFDEPDQARAYERGRLDVVEIGGLTVARETIEPGWRWSEHVKPIAGTEWCQIRHVGICVSGRLRFVMEDGTSRDVAAGELFDLPPGHDSWVVGDERVVIHETSAGIGAYALPAGAQRVLVTLLFTDIVGSTARAEQLGDQRWQQLIAQHDRVVRQEIDRYRGRSVKSTGDGFLASFDGAAKAVRCAVAVRDALAPLGLEIRAGVHTGEVEEAAGQLQGLAIHAAARVQSLAAAGEILVSSTTHDLLSGSGLSFVDRGSHELRGLSGERALYAVREAGRDTT